MKTRTFTRTKEQDEQLMRDLCKKHAIDLTFLTEDEGKGGYNYGASAGYEIILAPFVKTTTPNTKVGKYMVKRVCLNPLECRLAAFFHEFSHVMLSDNVPCICDGYSWNETSKMQFEIWITMCGFRFAQENCAIVFSDETVMWMLHESMSYYHKDNMNYARQTTRTSDTDYDITYDPWYDECARKKKKK